MRIRRFMISFCVALGCGAAWYFSTCATIDRGVEQAAAGFGQLIGTISDFASALAGESPSPRLWLAPVVSGYDWSAVSVVSGVAAIFALCFALYQLAALYDERA